VDSFFAGPTKAAILIPFIQIQSLMSKVLIVRFSSIGDIIQCMSVVGGIKHQWPDAELHWVTRSDMASLLKIDPRIDEIWEYDKKSGFGKLLKLFVQLRKQGFTHVYDAHSNIRSTILWWVFKLGFSPAKWVTRRKDRLKRLLLFSFGINLFPKPFRSFVSFQKPLNKWGVTLFDSSFNGWRFPEAVVEKVEALLHPSNSTDLIVLVPSAAWELKRWPVSYWQALVGLLPTQRFVVLGGPADVFCADIAAVAPDRVVNLAGKTSLMESFYAVYKAGYVISGDTGFLHAADLFDKPGQAIIGPTAFGFPSGAKMITMEVDLPCRPCTKDGNVKCKLKEHKKCIMDIRPDAVANQLFVSKS
jgi:ADP-heptose:LPS heptosyltransferase